MQDGLLTILPAVEESVLKDKKEKFQAVKKNKQANHTKIKQNKTKQTPT